MTNFSHYDLMIFVFQNKLTQLKLGQYSRWTAQQQLQAEQTTTDMILGQNRLLFKTNTCD